jgi:hypothetical protein
MLYGPHRGSIANRRLCCRLIEADSAERNWRKRIGNNTRRHRHRHRQRRRQREGETGRKADFTSRRESHCSTRPLDTFHVLARYLSAISDTENVPRTCTRQRSTYNNRTCGSRTFESSYLPFRRFDDLRFPSSASRLRSSARCSMLRSCCARGRDQFTVIDRRQFQTSKDAPLGVNIYNDVHRSATAVRERSIIAPITVLSERTTLGENASLGAVAPERPIRLTDLARNVKAFLV